MTKKQMRLKDFVNIHSLSGNLLDLPTRKYRDSTLGQYLAQFEYCVKFGASN